MQQAIPYKSWVPCYTKNNVIPTEDIINNNIGSKTNMTSLVLDNPVIVFARRGCCMNHVVKRLLLELGVNPAVYEIDEKDEDVVVQQLESFGGDSKKVQFPAVFIGGKLFGGLDRVMTTHISGELVPILKEAGALWL